MGKHDKAMAHNEKLLIADEEAAAAEEGADEEGEEAAPESAADTDAADQLAEQTSQLKVHIKILPSLILYAINNYF